MIIRLLVDTGSSFTILPVEVLEAVGCDPTASRERVRLITGNGIVVAPSEADERTAIEDRPLIRHNLVDRFCPRR